MTPTAYAMLAPLSVLVFLALRQAFAGSAAEKRLRMTPRSRGTDPSRSLPLPPAAAARVVLLSDFRRKK